MLKNNKKYCADVYCITLISRYGSKFSYKHFVTTPVAPFTTGIIIHFTFRIRLTFVHGLLCLNYFPLPRTRHFCPLLLPHLSIRMFSLVSNYLPTLLSLFVPHHSTILLHREINILLCVCLTFIFSISSFLHNNNNNNYNMLFWICLFYLSVICDKSVTTQNL